MRGGEEICDRVYLVGGPGLSSPMDALVYLVDAGSELMLIDAGLGQAPERIERNIRGIGLEPAGVWHIIATHCHIDHIGGLAALKERYGSRIIAHELDRPGIEGEDERLTAAGMYGVSYRPVRVDMPIEGEMKLLEIGEIEFVILHTPGHTPGSISAYFDSSDGRVLFGQDIHGPFSPEWGSDLQSWRASMERLLDLEADILCEGHAGIYRGPRVRGYIESCLKRYSST